MCASEGRAQQWLINDTYSHSVDVQELLQYTMHQHLPDPVEGLDEWATLESALPEGGPIPSVENGSPLISPR